MKQGWKSPTGPHGIGFMKPGVADKKKLGGVAVTELGQARGMMFCWAINAELG